MFDPQHAINLHESLFISLYFCLAMVVTLEMEPMTTQWQFIRELINSDQFWSTCSTVAGVKNKTEKWEATILQYWA